jgi:hypothetical protein
MPDQPKAKQETFPQACRRLIFEARDECVKRGGRITGEIIEQIISEQQQSFHLLPAKPIVTDSIAEAIYQAYPRHEGKKAALKAISVAMRATPASDLLKKVMEYAAAVKKWPDSFRYTKEGRDLVPHPATWFNEGRFMDDPKAWEQRSKPKSEPINYSKI